MNALIRKGDLWSGLALAALGAWIVSQAWGWTYMGEDGPGPGFFPRWYGAIMLVLSLLLVAGSVLKPGSQSPRRTVQWGEMGRAMSCWLALAVCIALLNVLGFIVAFALLTWFIVAILFRRPQLEALVIAVVGAVGFYALFAWGLGLQLPAGSLF